MQSRSSIRFQRSKPILFLPDINLGNYVKKQTGRENMKIWQGACIVHATFPARRVVAARTEHPDALVAAHPECPPDCAPHGGFHRIDFRHHRLVRPPVCARVHRDDGERRLAFAAQAGAGQEVLLRRERKLQLQRVSLT